MIRALDFFGRRMLAWPATLLGAALTLLGGALLRFAMWILDLTDDDLAAVEDE